MADNVTITNKANSTPPAGTVIATDKIGDAHFQWMKVMVGADGVAVPMLGNGDGEPVVVSHREHAIHEGKHWYIEGFTTLEVGNMYVKMVTPATDDVHLTWRINASGILETNFYEGSTGGMTGGTGVTPLNNLRTSTGTSGVVITQGVTTATTKGTKIGAKKVGGTGFKSVTGGEVDRAGELILKPSTVYFREFISTSTGNIVDFKAKWIEG